MDSPKGSIYIITEHQEPDDQYTGYFKVGFSYNPEETVEDLQTRYARKLKLLISWPANSKDEYSVHGQLAVFGHYKNPSEEGNEWYFKPQHYNWDRVTMEVFQAIPRLPPPEDKELKELDGPEC